MVGFRSGCEEGSLLLVFLLIGFFIFFYYFHLEILKVLNYDSQLPIPGNNRQCVKRGHMVAECRGGVDGTFGSYRKLNNQLRTGFLIDQTVSRCVVQSQTASCLSAHGRTTVQISSGCQT